MCSKHILATQAPSGCAPSSLREHAPGGGEGCQRRGKLALGNRGGAGGAFLSAGFTRRKALALGAMETPARLTSKNGKQEMDPSTFPPHPPVLCQRRKQSGLRTASPQARRHPDLLQRKEGWRGTKGWGGGEKLREEKRFGGGGGGGVHSLGRGPCAAPEPGRVPLKTGKPSNPLKVFLNWQARKERGREGRRRGEERRMREKEKEREHTGKFPSGHTACLFRSSLPILEEPSQKSSDDRM